MRVKEKPMVSGLAGGLAILLLSGALAVAFEDSGDLGGVGGRRVGVLVGMGVIVGVGVCVPVAVGVQVGGQVSAGPARRVAQAAMATGVLGGGSGFHRPAGFTAMSRYQIRTSTEAISSKREKAADARSLQKRLMDNLTPYPTNSARTILRSRRRSRWANSARASWPCRSGGALSSKAIAWRVTAAAAGRSRVCHS